MIMSVLYKALQKAEKENELRQSASEPHFKSGATAASGGLKTGPGGGLTASRIAMAVIVLVAVVGGGAFLVFKDALITPPAQQVASTVAPGAQPTPESILQPPASEVAVQEEADVEATADTEAVAAEQQNVEMVAAANEDPDVADEKVSLSEEAAGESEDRVVAEVSASMPAPAMKRPDPMPQLAVDSPVRMLNPPISVSRPDIQLAGVGDQVQVRQVSQSARTNVSAGYEALIRSDYGAALSFYDQALVEEPNSVLALLGRGAALQKMGRMQEAQGSYDRVLQLDPENREALTNVTAIVGERAPQEALARLLELEREYAAFSPIKAQIGLVYTKMGAMPQALDYFRRATALSPATMMYHYNMALALDHLGLHEQAIESYERVLESILTGRGPADLSSEALQQRLAYLKARR